MPSLSISKELVNAVRQRRVAGGLSYEQRAEGTSVPQTYFSRMQPSFRGTMLGGEARLTKVLTVDLSQLMAENLAQKTNRI
jgi:hypothetical protein